MATKVSFTEYCEDWLDLQIGLMSEQEIADALSGYERLAAPRPVCPTNPDLKRPVGDLRARCERLVNGQRNAVTKFSAVADFDQAALNAARTAVMEGERLLAKRATKAEFIGHAELNSQASRLMNAATQG